MAHSHGEAAGGAGQLDARRADSRRRMRIALGLNVAMLLAEAIGGWITGSLALLADAGHVLSDVGAIGLGLFAAGLAARPSGPRRTFGLQRSEIIAALANGLTLVAIAVLIVVEAISRLDDPPSLSAGPVLALGAFGLAGNVLATLVLARGERGDINLEGVLRHSAADALGSIGVIVSAIVILATGFEAADPLASLAIAALVLISSWRLIREPIDVLMEAAPSGLDVERLGEQICDAEHVRAVHDLHVWTVTSGFDALAAHVVVAPQADRDLVRRRLEVLLSERYGIDHTTLQMEEAAEPGLLQVEGFEQPRREESG